MVEVDPERDIKASVLEHSDDGCGESMDAVQLGEVASEPPGRSLLYPRTEYFEPSPAEAEAVAWIRDSQNTNMTLDFSLTVTSASAQLNLGQFEQLVGIVAQRDQSVNLDKPIGEYSYVKVPDNLIGSHPLVQKNMVGSFVRIKKVNDNRFDVDGFTAVVVGVSCGDLIVHCVGEQHRDLNQPGGSLLIRYIARLPNLRKLNLTSSWMWGSIREMMKNEPAFDQLQLDTIILRGLGLERPRGKGVLADLSDFRDFAPTLKHLDLSRILDMRGVLSDLSEHKQLTTLLLTDEKVPPHLNGNISALSGVPCLEHLQLSGAGIVGNIADIGDLKKLGHLWLKGANVQIDLKDLSRFAALSSVEVPEQSVGSLETIGSLTYLTGLHIEGATGVSGDVSSLKEMTRLKSLWIMEAPRIKGHIESFKDLGALEELVLPRQRELHGDVSILKNLRKLQVISIRGTKIRGDLRPVLPGLPLRILDVSGSKTRLDITTLEGHEYLEELDAGDVMRLTGDISGLQGKQFLRQISVARTAVTGDLKALHQLPLQVLDVTNTSVTGSVNGLLSEDGQLKVLKAGGSNIDGKITTTLAANSNTVEVLDLSGTNADIAFLREASCRGGTEAGCSENEGDMLFPNLKQLVLADVKMESETGNAPLATATLGVFRNHKELTQIDFSGMGLTGDLDGQFLQEVQNASGVVVSDRSIDYSPLGHALLKLILARNEILTVSMLPTISLDEMVLKGNRNLTELPSKWFRDSKAYLDVSDTQLVNKDMKLTLTRELAKEDMCLYDRKLGGQFLGEESPYSCLQFEVSDSKTAPPAGRVIVSPETFDPLNLCSCNPGFAGRGVTCIG
jgi:hypothetical protein